MRAALIGILFLVLCICFIVQSQTEGELDRIEHGLKEIGQRKERELDPEIARATDVNQRARRLVEDIDKFVAKHKEFIRDTRAFIPLELSLDPNLARHCVLVHEGAIEKPGFDWDRIPPLDQPCLPMETRTHIRAMVEYLRAHPEATLEVRDGASPDRATGLLIPAYLTDLEAGSPVHRIGGGCNDGCLPPPRPPCECKAQTACLWITTTCPFPAMP